jgi:hypothetical protein
MNTFQGLPHQIQAQDGDQWGGSCQHGNEPSGSINFWEVLE